MGVKFYHEDSMSQARATLEARVLLWPHVQPVVALDCPSYLVGEQPFAVLVDGAILLPPGLPPDVLEAPPADVPVLPMREESLALDGWLRVSAASGEEVLRALPLVRASYQLARAAADLENDQP